MWSQDLYQKALIFAGNAHKDQKVKNKKMKKEDQIQDSLNRIKTQSKEIWMIKLADRITNLQKPPSSWSKEKIKYYYNDAKLIYKELKECSKFLSERIKS